MKTAFIQTRNDGQILNQGNYTAYYGFTKLGYRIVFYSSALDYTKKLEQLPLPVTAGGIDTIRQIFSDYNIQQPLLQKPHVELPDFLKRKIDEMSYGDFVKYTESEFFKPIFIKPLEEDKAFTGFVFKHRKDLLQFGRSLPNDFMLLTSEIVEFQSEFRVFIQDRKIIDCKNYTGNFWLRPNPHIIQDAINAYVNQPIAYTLDWAIDMNGNTILVEINDAFGVAPYGLDPVKYARFLEARWNEIINKRHYNEIV